MFKELVVCCFVFLAVPVFSHVAVLAPIGGETFVVGEEVVIKWADLIVHDLEDWDILFSSDGGINWESVKKNVDPFIYAFTWTVPDIVTSQGSIKVVQDNMKEDYSDFTALFSIVGEQSTAVNSEKEYPTFDIYPNPTSGIINFGNVKPTSIMLFDVNGNLLGKVISNNGQIDIVGCKTGVYFLLLRYREKNQIIKVIKN